MPDDLVERLRRFKDDYFPQHQNRFQDLVAQGQHPTTLFIGCSDSRLVPYLLTGAGPGELFLVRNVGAFVPPWDGSHGVHGTAAAIEYAILVLHVKRIIVCGHSHCGAIRALYEDLPEGAVNLKDWLDIGREAMLPVRLFAPETPEASPPQGGVSVLGRPGDGLRPEVLHRTEQRSIVLALERLMEYPMVRSEVEAHRLTLHGWYYVIEDGEVHVFDVQQGNFVPASKSEHSGTGPYPDAPDDGELFNEISATWPPA
jgi:carbonic anhydrase